MEGKRDRTDDILVGLFNFKKAFLATNEELPVTSAFQSTSARTWTVDAEHFRRRPNR